MALRRKGGYWYGDSQDDIPAELKRYGKANRYEPTVFADARCSCGGKAFRLRTDEEEGVAVRSCITCAAEHPIGDSAAYLEGASLESHVCLCDSPDFEITVGLALYTGSEDIRWLYIGCRCLACGLVGNFADWKNEYSDYRKLLALV